VLSPHLAVQRPGGAFYLWPEVQGDDERFARELYARQNVTVLPGSYLSRATAGADPGRRRLRISLVPPVAQCLEAAARIVDFLRVRPVRD
jgi:N-succinyldiaminopimelate aminotransferase